MKIVLLGLVVMVFYAGLLISSAAAQETKELKIVTSFYPMYIIALNVAGRFEGVSVENMTPPITGCLHDYSVTAADMKKIESAHIFVANGAGMESFLERVVTQYPQVQAIILSDGLELIQEGGEEAVNPHVWVSISGAIDQTHNLVTRLIEADPIKKRVRRIFLSSRPCVRRCPPSWRPIREWES